LWKLNEFSSDSRYFLFRNEVGSKTTRTERPIGQISHFFTKVKLWEEWARYLIKCFKFGIAWQNFRTPFEVIFSTVLFIQISDDYVISEETNCNCCIYCSLSVYSLLFTASYYLRSPILWSVFSISMCRVGR